MTNNSMFASNYNKGFAMTFNNGLTISVQWGAGNYCDRRDFHSSFDADLKVPKTQSPDAEIAIWDEAGTWFNFGYDTVRGFCSTDEVGMWIAAIRVSSDLDDLRTMAIREGIIDKVEDDGDQSYNWTMH